MAITAMSFKILRKGMFYAFLAAFMAAVLVSSYQFEVGEERGWRKPTGKEPETYNEWAAKNRFHIGDALNFKYKKDSVLLVSSADYLACNTSSPHSRYEDGNTVFQFDHSGFFYFISGQPGHCKSGQRIIVRVMHPSELESPSPAPLAGSAAGPGGDAGGTPDWGSPEVSSSSKLSAMIHLAVAPASIYVVFCSCRRDLFVVSV